MTPNQYLDVVGARVDLMDAAATLAEMQRKFRDAAGKLMAETQRQEAELGRRYSVARALQCAATPKGGVVDGPEREVSEELARQVGLKHDLHRPFLPFWAMLRALNAGTGSAGGYLVGQNTSRQVDALFPASTLVRMGANVVPVSGDFAYPRIVTNGTAYWSSELNASTSADPVFGSIPVSQKTVSAVTSVTKQLLLQGGEAAKTRVVTNLVAVVGAAIDAAMIAGTGTTTIEGIVNLSVGTTIVGTNFGWAAAHALLRVVAAANVPDENIRWLAAPSVRETLAQRASGTGAESHYIWQRNSVADKPAFVSSNVPASTILCGDPTTIDLLMWTGGVQVAIDPYSNFMSEIQTIKVTAYGDAVVTQPQAWAVGTSLS